MIFILSYLVDFFAIDRPLFFASTKVKAICDIIFFCIIDVLCVIEFILD